MFIHIFETSFLLFFNVFLAPFYLIKYEVKLHSFVNVMFNPLFLLFCDFPLDFPRGLAA